MLNYEMSAYANIKLQKINISKIITKIQYSVL